MDAALADRIAATSWYHTLELPGGIVTPGEYDQRDVVRRMPLAPSLAGQRCLDVGTRDGFWAFELERRGAAEVVGIDLDDPRAVDWPAPRPEFSDEVRRELAARSRAFDVAAAALGSRVLRRDRSVYALDPAHDGSFDLAFFGTLLLHLRDPVGALSAVHGVLNPGGRLVLNEPVSLPLTVLRRGPAASLLTLPEPFWWVPNVQALRRFAEAAGFRVLATGRPYLLHSGRRPNRARWSLGSLAQRAVLRGGVPHAWLLAEA